MLRSLDDFTVQRSTFRLLDTASAWLEGFDDRSLSESLSFEKLTAVSDKAEHVATKLSVKELAALHTKSPQGFRRLLSMSTFVTKIVELEDVSKKRVRGYVSF